MITLKKIQQRLEKAAKSGCYLTPQVYGYIRTSKSEKSQKYSADYQERLIREYYQRMSGIPGSKLHGSSWGGCFVDRVSGKTDLITRTAGRVLLNRVLPGDILICYNLDRMSRSLWGSAEIFRFFLACNVHLMTVDGEVDLTTATGRTLAMIKIGFAEVERERLIERVKLGLEQRRLRRKDTVSPRVAPGWKRTKRKGEWIQLPCKAARETAHKIVIWRDQEMLAWDKISFRLRRKNIWHGMTKEWATHTVQDWYSAAKNGFPNNSAHQRENMPPLMIEVPDAIPAGSKTPG